MLRRAPLLLALTGSAGLAPAALASLPSPKSHAIKPGKAIGGVKVGMSLKAAKAAWGPGADCRTVIFNYACDWKGTEQQGAASITFAQGKPKKAFQIRIVTGFGGNGDLTPSYTGPLTKLKTAKAIRLGSTRKALLKAYPKAKKTSSSRDITEYTLKAGKHGTTFEVNKPGGNKVAAITVY